MAEGNGDSGDWDIDAFLDGYKRRTKTVTIYQRGDLVDEHARLEAELAASAADGDPDQARKILDRIKAITMELEGSGRTFHLEACSHDEWYQLMATNPPTEDERKAMPGSAVGADFQAHAMAACVRQPQVSVDQAQRMRASMRPDDYDRLWLAVIECVEGQVEVPKSGLATAVASLFDASSTPRGNRAARRRSSSAGKGARSPSTSTTKKAG